MKQKQSTHERELRYIENAIAECLAHDTYGRDEDTALFDLCRISDKDAMILKQAQAQGISLSSRLQAALDAWQRGIEMGRFSGPATSCSVCANLPAISSAFQKYGDTENDTFLPVEFYNLFDENNQPPSAREPKAGLYHCPACGTRFELKTTHEYLAGGSEDEQTLIKL